jgi:hypothetical protein
MAPPAAGGRTIARYVLELPARRDLRLKATVRFTAKQPKTNGAALTVLLAGKPLLKRKLTPADGQVPIDVPVAPAGGRAELELVVDSLGEAKDDGLALVTPRIVSGDKPVADLVELAGEAVARIDPDDRQLERISWHKYAVPSPNGRVAWHDIFPPPTNYKVAYGVAEVVSQREQAVRAEVAADEGCAIWLNGRRVYAEPRKASKTADLTLREGVNRLFVKASNFTDWWYTSLRLVDKEGRRAEGVTVKPWE